MTENALQGLAVLGVVALLLGGIFGYVLAAIVRRSREGDDKPRP